MHQLIRTFFADPAWLPGFTEFETTAEPDALLTKVIAPAIKTLKQLPRTSVRGMWIKQNKSGL
jgi:hypothetical protein